MNFLQINNHVFLPHSQGCYLHACPCGFWQSGTKECTCSDYERKRYINKISGPLLDRIDIFSPVNALSYTQIKNENKKETSKEIRLRVEKARQMQKERFINEGIYCNAQMNERLINKYCKLNSKTNRIIEKIYEKFNLSTRSYSRILKVSRSIADLNSREKIEEEDVIEALQYRKYMDQTII
ncbi:ATP-binding protein [Clostridium ganghwense]|uniref:ATP-binding protein n=1 Tax=Clostridium ganghwense TaxID=312089 RepID=A0ABT4CTU0_9CLOT|nr:ATP-binding protein [Clostridium ganghwense]